MSASETLEYEFVRGLNHVLDEEVPVLHCLEGNVTVFCIDSSQWFAKRGPLTLSRTCSLCLIPSRPVGRHTYVYIVCARV